MSHVVSAEYAQLMEMASAIAAQKQLARLIAHLLRLERGGGGKAKRGRVRTRSRALLAHFCFHRAFPYHGVDCVDDRNQDEVIISKISYSVNAISTISEI